MTPLKTIVATAVIAVAGTVAAFGGLHLGQSSADAATATHPVKAKTTYTITLTAKQLAQLMHGQDNGTPAHERHASRQGSTDLASTHNYGGTTSGSSQQTSQAGAYHHIDTSHSNDWDHHAEGSGSHSGGCND